MRIIAGEFRGRKLLAPDTDATRPVTDRVKQSMFDILAPQIEGTRVYDCFAGTGSMGLECLSRGAAFATFFEADRSALARLRRNIADVGVSDRAKVIEGDLFRWAERSAPRQADLIFLDPPYRFLKDRPGDLVRLAKAFAARHLTADGIVVFRHDARDKLELPPLERYDQRDYGGMVVEFLRPPTPTKAVGKES